MKIPCETCLVYPACRKRCRQQRDCRSKVVTRFLISVFTFFAIGCLITIIIEKIYPDLRPLLGYVLFSIFAATMFIIVSGERIVNYLMKGYP